MFTQQKKRKKKDMFTQLCNFILITVEVPYLSNKMKIDINTKLKTFKFLNLDYIWKLNIKV